MGFWTYGDADSHTCNDRCWLNGDPKGRHVHRAKKRTKKTDKSTTEKKSK